MTLEERKKILVQKKARLQKDQALLKIKEKKQTLSRKIRIGELAEKTGIFDLNLETLLGAFLFLKEQLKDKKIVLKWEEDGKKHIPPSTQKVSKGIPLSISFPSLPPPEFIKTLKSHKFKWNSIRNMWEGHGEKKEIVELVADHSGMVSEI